MEIETFKTTLFQKETDISNLKDELLNKDNKLNEIVSEREQLLNHMNNLDEERNSLKLHLADLENQYDQTVQVQNNKLSEINVELESLKQMCDELKCNVAQLESEKESLDLKLAGITEKHQAEIENLQQLNTSIENRNVKDIQTHNERLAELNDELGDLKQTNYELKTEIAKLEAERESLNQKLAQNQQYHQTEMDNLKESYTSNDTCLNEKSSYNVSEIFLCTSNVNQSETDMANITKNYNETLEDHQG